MPKFTVVTNNSWYPAFIWAPMFIIHSVVFYPPGGYTCIGLPDKYGSYIEFFINAIQLYCTHVL